MRTRTALNASRPHYVAQKFVKMFVYFLISVLLFFTDIISYGKVFSVKVMSMMIMTNKVNSFIKTLHWKLQVHSQLPEAPTGGETGRFLRTRTALNASRPHYVAQKFVKIFVYFLISVLLFFTDMIIYAKVFSVKVMSVMIMTNKVNSFIKTLYWKLQVHSQNCQFGQIHIKK